MGELNTDAELLAARSSPAGLAYLASRRRYMLPPHLAYLNRRLLDLASRNGKRNLAVSMPPRYGKSETCSRYFPPWYLGTFPNHHVLFASYEANFAARWGRASRDVLEAHGQELFNVEVSRASRAAKAWDIVGYEGGMQTAGAGGAITGKGANCLIIDDPIKNHKDALNKDRRDDVWDWWESTASSRRETELATGLEPITLIIMTRWHEDDLLGRILAQEGEDWEVVNFPLIATDNDALGRVEGDILWNARHTKRQAKRLKQKTTPYWFQSLYQGQPRPDDGGIVKRSWIKYFDQHPNRELFDERGWPILDLAKGGRGSVDCAFKDTDGSDYVVIGAWYKHQADRFLIDVSRAKRDFTRTCDDVEAWHLELRVVLVEDKANGPAVLNVLQRKRRGLVPFDPTSHGSKEARLHAVAPTFRGTNVWLPRPVVPSRSDPPLTEGVPVARAEWVSDYIDELTTFPKATHDDQVDMTSQALLDMEARRKPHVGAVKKAG